MRELWYTTAMKAVLCALLLAVSGAASAAVAVGGNYGFVAEEVQIV